MAYYKEYNSRNDNNQDKPPFSWVMVLFLFIAGAWPVALIFLMINLSQTSKARQVNKNFRTQWQGNTYRGSFNNANSNSTETPDANALRILKRARSLKNSNHISTLLLVACGVFLLFAAPHAAAVFRDLSIGMFDSFTVEYDLLPAIYHLVCSGVLGFFGTRIKRNLRLENLMATITGQADNISIQELSDASGYSKKKVLDLVKDAINHGLFGSDAYIDMRTETLVIRGKAPEPAPQTPPTPAEPKPEPAPENDYQAILRQLREVNDAIPGEEMSDKIDQLEAISARIFAMAEKSPEKKPQLSKFMDYYLPTALKLLNTYATLDKQGAPGSNVSETMTSIENAMDMLVHAFSSQLDKLFQSDALDVSSDIAALQSMLTMDGLTPEGPFGVSSPQ